MLPIIWAETATQNLHSSFKEVTLKLQRELAGLRPEERLQKVIKEVAEFGVPHFFTSWELKEDVRARLEELNKSELAGRPKWTWEQNGYCGAHLPEEQLQEVFTQTDLIRMWGLATWLWEQT